MSDLIKGAVVGKGGAFTSDYGNFRNTSVWPASRFVEEAVAKIDAMQLEGDKIDDINNLKDRAVYIFSGEKDGSVPPHNQ